MNDSLQLPLNKFLADVNKLKVEYWNQSGFTFNSPPKVMVHSEGKRYARLGVFEQNPPHTGPFVSVSVYCFVDLTNGDLLKGNWKAPVKNGVRGNLNNADTIKNFDQHGPKYLR